MKNHSHSISSFGILTRAVLIGGLVSMSVACTSGKDSKNNSESPAPKTQEPQKDPEAPVNRNHGPATAEDRMADNSANELKFDGNLSEEEKSAMLEWSKRFTGTAQDDLRSYLLTKIENESRAEVANKSLRFSNSIITARLKVSPDKKAFKVVLKIKDPRQKNLVSKAPEIKEVEAGGPKKNEKVKTDSSSKDSSAAEVQSEKGAEKFPEKYLSFSGRIQDVIESSSKSSQAKNQRRIYLRAFDRVGNEFKNQNGTLECADVQMANMVDCQTKVATIRLNGAKAVIIFRTSDFSLAADFREKCLMDTCEKFYEMFKNTEYSVASQNRIKSRIMESFEVLNGRSAISVLILSYENEIVKIEGELNDPQHSRFAQNAMEELMNKELSSEEIKEVSTGILRKTTYNKFLESVRMTGNDGNGNLVFLARSPLNKEAADLNLIEISMSRILKPTRTLK